MIEPWGGDDNDPVADREDDSERLGGYGSWQRGRRSRAVMDRLGMHDVRQLTRPGVVEGLEGVHASAPVALYRISAAARSAPSEPLGPSTDD